MSIDGELIYLTYKCIERHIGIYTSMSGKENGMTGSKCKSNNVNEYIGLLCSVVLWSVCGRQQASRVTEPALISFPRWIRRRNPQSSVWQGEYSRVYDGVTSSVLWHRRYLPPSVLSLSTSLLHSVIHSLTVYATSYGLL